MGMLVLLSLVLAFLCFGAGAIGLSARVGWDAAGKAFLVLAVITQWWPLGK